MKSLQLTALTGPFVLAGLVTMLVLRHPGETVGAYASGGSVYAAQVLIPTQAPSAQVVGPAVRPRPLGETLTSPAPALQTTRSSALALPAAGFVVSGPPSVSPAVIDQVLSAYGSPMAGEGQRLYDLGVKYGIDPAFCLAFFVHESAAGTRGEAVITHNLGNIRTIAGLPSRDGYRYFDTWLEGAEAWYRLIKGLYVGKWGLTTVGTIIPVYAPSADSNDPAAYIDDVEQLVTAWRAQN